MRKIVLKTVPVQLDEVVGEVVNEVVGEDVDEVVGEDVDEVVGEDVDEAVDEANSANEPFPAVMEATVSDFPEPEILDEEDRNNRTAIDFSVS